MEERLACQESEDIATIIIPGHYIDAHMATEKSLLNSSSEKIRIFAKSFKPIDLSSDEHRAMTALWSLYHKAGHKEEVYRKGICFTAYELCKRMAYLRDKKGRFGGKARKAALDALLSLSRRSFDIYVTKWIGKKRGKDIFDVVVIPNSSLIDIQYSASSVTEEDMMKGGIKGKVAKIHVRVKPFFYKEGYYLLFEKNFYSKLKEILGKENRKVSKYHWNFAIWLLKQKLNKKRVEINVDKLAAALKIPSGAGHRARARSIARGLYEDFKRIGYIMEYKIGLLAQKESTKDVIIIHTGPHKQLSPGDVGR